MIQKTSNYSAVLTVVILIGNQPFFADIFFIPPVCLENVKLKIICFSGRNGRQLVRGNIDSVVPSRIARYTTCIRS